jgi:predicted aldo/keto reductase-like oxidoreductase
MRRHNQGASFHDCLGDIMSFLLKRLQTWRMPQQRFNFIDDSGLGLVAARAEKSAMTVTNMLA